MLMGTKGVASEVERHFQAIKGDDAIFCALWGECGFTVVGLTN